MFLTFLKFIIHEAYKLTTLNIRVDIVTYLNRLSKNVNVSLFTL